MDPTTFEILHSHLFALLGRKIQKIKFSSYFQVVLNSMHRFQPRIYLVTRPEGATGPITDIERERYRSYIYPETIFTAVTAYQNQLVRIIYRIICVHLENSCNENREIRRYLDFGRCLLSLDHIRWRSQIDRTSAQAVNSNSDFFLFVSNRRLPSSRSTVIRSPKVSGTRRGSTTTRGEWMWVCFTPNAKDKGCRSRGN